MSDAPPPDVVVVDDVGSDVSDDDGESAAVAAVDARAKRRQSVMVRPGDLVLSPRGTTLGKVDDDDSGGAQVTIKKAPGEQKTARRATTAEDPSQLASFFIKADNSWERVANAPGQQPRHGGGCVLLAHIDGADGAADGGGTGGGTGGGGGGGGGGDATSDAATTLLVWGGAKAPSAGDVFAFNTATRKWRLHSSPDADAVAAAPRGTVGVAAAPFATIDSSLAYVFVGGRVKSKLPGQTNISSDVHVYDASTRRWSRAPDQGAAFAKRTHAAAAYSRATRRTFVFGGRAAKDRVLGDLHEFNGKTLRFEPLDAVGDVRPAPRAGATLVALDASNELALLGGADADDRLVADLHLFSLDTRRWRRVDVDQRFARAHHACVARAHSLYVYGGVDASGAAAAPLLLECDVRSAMWSIVEAQAAADEMPRHVPVDAPLALAPHAMWLATRDAELFEFTFEDKGFVSQLARLVDDADAMADIARVRAPWFVDDGAAALDDDVRRCIAVFLATERFDPSPIGASVTKLVHLIDAVGRGGTPERLRALAEHRAQRLVTPDTVAEALVACAAVAAGGGGEALANVRRYCVRYVVDHASACIEREDMQRVDAALLLEIMSYTSGAKQPPPVEAIRVPPRRLADDLRRLVGTGDCELVDGVRVPRFLFDARCTDIDGARRVAADLPRGAVAAFARFLATDVVDFPTEVALDLLRLAHAAGMREPRLRRTATSVARLRPRREQLLYGLRVADELDDAELREFMLSTIVSMFGWVGRQAPLDDEAMVARPHLLRLIVERVAASTVGAARSDRELGIVAGQLDNASELVADENTWVDVGEAAASPLPVDAVIVESAQRRAVAAVTRAAGVASELGRSRTLACVDADGTTLHIVAAAAGRAASYSTVARRFVDGGDVDRLASRAGASLVYVREQRKCIVFGGARPSTGALSSDVLECEMSGSAERRWRRVKGSGAATAPRAHHSAVVHRSRMFVVGGRTSSSSNKDMARTVVAYDLVARQWSTVGESDAIAREGHSANVHQDAMYVYGGESAADGVLGDVLKFDFATEKWVRVRTAGAPPPRAFHAAAVVNGDLLVFGGRLASGQCDASLYALSLGTTAKAWRRVDTGERPVRARSHAAMAATAGGVVHVYGGVDADGAFLGQQTHLELTVGDGGFKEAMVALRAAAGDDGHRFMLDARLGSVDDDDDDNGGAAAAAVAAALDEPVRALLLDFVYLDAVPKLGAASLETVMALLGVAKRLKLARLALMCERACLARLSIETVGRCAQLAHEHGHDESIKNACLQYIADNAAAVLDAKEALEALDSKLLVDIMRATRADVARNELPRVVLTPAGEAKSRMAHDMARLLTLAGDAHIDIDGRRFEVHTPLVAARCQVSPLDDGGGSASADAFGAFLAFVYTDQCDFRPETAVDLLELSHRYQLSSKRLRDAARRVIRVAIDLPGALRAMAVADRIGDAETKDVVSRRIVAQFAKTRGEVGNDARVMVDLLRALALTF